MSAASKKAAVALAMLFAGVGLLSVRRCGVPPRDSELVDQFRAHRTTFEELNRRLQEDDRLERLAHWGVVTTGSPLANKPPKGDFPRARYEEYLALLKQAGGGGVFRSRGSCPEACVLVWGFGWAADTRHVAVCTRCDVPSHQVSSLDEWKPDRTGRVGREFVYRHLEGNWYLREDW